MINTYKHIFCVIKIITNVGNHFFFLIYTELYLASLITFSLKMNAMRSALPVRCCLLLLHLCVTALVHANTTEHVKTYSVSYVIQGVDQSKILSEEQLAAGR